MRYVVVLLLIREQRLLRLHPRSDWTLPFPSHLFFYQIDAIKVARFASCPARSRLELGHETFLLKSFDLVWECHGHRHVSITAFLGDETNAAGVATMSGL